MFINRAVSVLVLGQDMQVEEGKALYIYVVFKIICIFFLSLQKVESFF